MFENDYIMRQIEGLTRFLAKVLMQKDMGSADVIDEQGHLDPGNFLLYRLQGMVGKGAINEAEDLLFDAIKAEPRREYLKVAIDFYSLLQGMEDDALKAADFTRQEIAEGLRDVRAIYGADGPDALI